MKHVYAVTSHHAHSHPKENNDNLNTRKSLNCAMESGNPWKSKQLIELGWSEFMKKKAEEALKSLDEKQIHASRRQRTLTRTSSAPVNIPQNKNRNSRSRGKKDLVRVSSTGGSVQSEGSPRITYGREFLLDCRQSPLCSTPPSNLPVIPGATAPIQRRTRKKLEKTDSNISAASASSHISTEAQEGEADH